MRVPAVRPSQGHLQLESVFLLTKAGHLHKHSLGMSKKAEIIFRCFQLNKNNLQMFSRKQRFSAPAMR